MKLWDLIDVFDLINSGETSDKSLDSNDVSPLNDGVGVVDITKDVDFDIDLDVAIDVRDIIDAVLDVDVAVDDEIDIVFGVDTKVGVAKDKETLDDVEVGANDDIALWDKTRSF